MDEPPSCPRFCRRLLAADSCVDSTDKSIWCMVCLPDSIRSEWYPLNAVYQAKVKVGLSRRSRGSRRGGSRRCGSRCPGSRCPLVVPRPLLLFLGGMMWWVLYMVLAKQHTKTVCESLPTCQQHYQLRWTQSCRLVSSLIMYLVILGICNIWTTGMVDRSHFSIRF